MRRTDYVEKFANSIETKLDMNSEEIAKMSRQEFRSLLKHGYFTRKRYKNYQSEPTLKQLDVLELHYQQFKPKPKVVKKVKPTVVKKKVIKKRIVKKKVVIKKVKPFYNVNQKFYYWSVYAYKKEAPKYIKRNSAGRFIDAKTGKFVTTKK